jgi:hypothetical protein
MQCTRKCCGAPARRHAGPPRPRAILDDNLRARPHAFHQRSKVARRFRLRNVDHILSHEAIIHRYLLMLWPSACVCSRTWPRADDDSILCAEETDSRLCASRKFGAVQRSKLFFQSNRKGRWACGPCLNLVNQIRCDAHVREPSSD